MRAKEQNPAVHDFWERREKKQNPKWYQEGKFNVYSYEPKRCGELVLKQELVAHDGWLWS